MSQQEPTYDEWIGDHLNALVMACHDAGAHANFCRVLMEPAPTGGYNAVARRLYSAHATTPGSHVPDEETCENVANRSGHFFKALWDGQLWEAYCRADHKNTDLLRAAFDEWEVALYQPARKAKDPSEYGDFGEWELDN